MRYYNAEARARTRGYYKGFILEEEINLDSSGFLKEFYDGREKK
jgi:hypothetical protein